MNLKIFLGGCALALGCSACGPEAPVALTDDRSITLTSSSLVDGVFPKESTCDAKDGVGTSPQLAWTGGPSNAAAWAVVIQDFDFPAALGGPGFHWGVWNIPAATKELAAGQATEASLASGADQAKNLFDKLGYAGPCPPFGLHHYHMRIYALDAEVDLAGGAARAAMFEALKPHVIAGGELVATYTR